MVEPPAPGRAERRWLEWGVASRPLAGEPESGDSYLVEWFPGGALLAVVDGLGHGPEAVAAARGATAVLAAHAAEPVAALVQRCHEALRGTRGAALSLASFDRAARTLTWLGVGNVAGVLLRPAADGGVASQALLLTGGIVGDRLPPPRPTVVPLPGAATLLLATDGVRGGFAAGLPLDAPPSQLADRVLARHGRATDDALVLVVRYHGPMP